MTMVTRSRPQYNDFSVIWTAFAGLFFKVLNRGSAGARIRLRRPRDGLRTRTFFSASKSEIVIFVIGSDGADPSPLLRVEPMWYKVDFSAILGGFIGLIIMLVVIALFSSPLSVERLLSILLP